MRPSREQGALRDALACGSTHERMDPAASSAPRREGERLRLGDEYYVLASSLASRRRKHILSHGDTFVVLDQTGDIPLAPDEELGLFFRGTRHLSQLELLASGRPPFFLSGAVTADHLRAIANLTNDDVSEDGRLTPRSTLSIRRTTLLCAPQMLTRLVLHSFSREPLRVRLELRLAADFRDIFEVRGVRRVGRGSEEGPLRAGAGIVFTYRGLDRVRRATRCEVSGAAAAWEGGDALLEVDFAPQEERIVDVTVTCVNEEAAETVCHGFLGAEATRHREHRLWQVERAGPHAADDGLNAVMAQALADVFMLSVPPQPGTLHAADRTIYAGIPWYATIFGRDALITARQMLWVAPGLARGVLRVLAALQGTTVNPARDEEPGRIIHEARYGEMAATGEVPFGRYYGSVDATPLFCMVLGAYVRATGDLALARELWPNALAAVGWMEHHGDRDGDGYLEYGRQSEHGLANQGWKDSGDAIFHRDGTLAEPPVAVVEAQGYRHAALLAMADVAEALGVEGAPRWRAQAAALSARINADFWLESDDTYALALDRDKRPCAVVTSNPGHLLFCGVPDAPRAQRLAARLLRADLFCGWGIRSLASGQPRYNPMSYHNGSVWPHDNSLIAAGLRRYGQVEGALEVMTALVEAALQFEDHRLPELFCGFGRRRDVAPVPYPVACRPQAWAAGSVFLLLEAALGVEPDARAGRVVFRQPQLPAWLRWLEIRNLRVGEARLDLQVVRGRYGGSIEILRKEGELEVVEMR
jgi:glycogen debranching enzyme